MDTEDLIYSEEAKLSMVYLYDDTNDINFFIEDAGKAYVYETIFKRLFGDLINIEKIFDVGGKPALISAFKEMGKVQKDNKNINNFYIADGDFDRWIDPSGMVSDSHFIYLESYNIENYLIDKSATEIFAKGFLRKNDIEVEKKVKFLEWYDRIVEEASELFFYYCYAKKFHPEVTTVSRSPYLFLDQKDGFKDSARSDIETFIRTLPEPINFSELDEIKKEYYKIHDSNFHIICGKFLMTSLFCHLSSLAKWKLRSEDLTWSNIMHFDIGKLEFIKTRVLKELSNDK